MIVTEQIKQAIELLKTSQMLSVDDEIAGRFIIDALALLTQLKPEACPVCKGDGLRYALASGEPDPINDQPCSACSGNGDYKSWAENQLQIADGKVSTMLIQLAEKDKQIAELKAEIKRLDARASGLWEVIHKHEAALAAAKEEK